MPYIDQVYRDDVDEYILALTSKMTRNKAGLLNYVITQIIQETHDLDGYHSINQAIGVLECAKMELYRRVAVPYEDEKMKENGDVY